MPSVDNQTITVEADRQPSATPTGKARHALHRRQRPVLVGGAVVLILAIRMALGVIDPSVNSGERAAGTVSTSPEQAVRALFAAMSARDATAIHTVTSCHASPLCQPGALAAGYLPPTDLQTAGVRTTVMPSHAVHPIASSRVVMLVSYRLGGQLFHDSVGLTQTSEGRPRHWWINGPPGRALLLHSPHVAHATIAAVTLPTTTDRTAGPRDSSPSSLWALPGTYTITAVPSRLYDAEPLTVTVGGPAQQTTITPPVRIKPSAVDEVHRQVNDHIDACAAQDTLAPRNPGSLTTHGCPFRAPDRFTITRHVQWTIATYPQLALAVTDDGPVQVTTTTRGEAVVSYEWTTDIVGPRRWTRVTERIEFSVGGHVTIGDDGAPRWSP